MVKPTPLNPNAEVIISGATAFGLVDALNLAADILIAARGGCENEAETLAMEKTIQVFAAYKAEVLLSINRAQQAGR